MIRRVAAAADRLAEWADQTILPNVLYGLLFIDAGTGAVWALSGPESFKSPVYDAAKMLAPMRIYGLLFFLIAVATYVSYQVRGRGFRTGWLLGGVLMGLWLFWSAIFTLGTLGRPGATYVGTVFAVGMVFLHAITGLALSQERAAHSTARG